MESPVHPDEDPEEGLSLEELEGEEASALPAREAMSVIDMDVAIPLNAAVAADVLAAEPSDSSALTEAEEPPTT